MFAITYEVFVPKAPLYCTTGRYSSLWLNFSGTCSWYLYDLLCLLCRIVSEQTSQYIRYLTLQAYVCNPDGAPKTKKFLCFSLYLACILA